MCTAQAHILALFCLRQMSFAILGSHVHICPVNKSSWLCAASFVIITQQPAIFSFQLQILLINQRPIDSLFIQEHSCFWQSATRNSICGYSRNLFSSPNKTQGAFFQFSTSIALYIFLNFWFIFYTKDCGFPTKF